MQKMVVLLIAMLSSALCFAQDSTSTSVVDSVSNDVPKQETGILSIRSSEPAGVWVNELAVGNTPFSMELPVGWVVYSVRLPGYWTEVSLVNIELRTEASQEVILKKYGLPAYGVQADVSHINDMRVLENMYDSLSKQKPEITPDSLCLAHFVEDYPLPHYAPVPLNENSPEYRSYYNIYANERQLSFYEWYSNCSGAFIQQDMSFIITRIKELGNKQVVGFVPAVGAKFEATAPGGLKGDLELFFRSPDGRADVAWKGVWESEFLAGDDLVRALVASAPVALAFLTTQNEAVWIPVENGYSRRFYKYSELNISWNGLLIPMQGKFILPDYILSQPEVALWVNGNIPVRDSVVQDSIIEVVIPDRIPEVVPEVIPEIVSENGALLARIPGGIFNYRGKEMEIKPFSINTREVNQGIYKSTCGEKNFGKQKGDSLTAHSVNWNEANKCCIALGGELPTEAEWEYAAKAGSPNKVVSEGPNGWGLYDMFGNVSEWIKGDGFWFGKYKYLKGGNKKISKKDLAVEYRIEEDARYWGTHTGFRCVFR